uniref:probable 2-oxoglutarate-dependent dioxygenase AOP1 n=1 Tax=Erigeron canadensis TaxID=72917 RepID=UPI001CB9578D|nr:probable 2-oxoglutarate-dependent dioxygenase AOP1 [Erigeron canadensis]
MGSQPPLQLPTIDFSSLHKHDQGTLAWDAMKTQVLKALQQFGCFEASFNQISLGLLESVFASLKQLFYLPLETKQRNHHENPVYGYIGPSKDNPLYESLGIEDIQSFTNILWPHNGNPEFFENMKKYIEKLAELDEMVRMMVLECLNLEKYMVEHMELSKYITRVMRYRVPDEHEPELGLGDHADKNIVTILRQDDVGGLQIQNKDGEWIEAKTSTANCFVVMAGESFHAWTNGRVRAPVHRVVMKGDQTRFSIGLFSVGKPGKFIKAPEEMVNEDYPLLFKPFDYEEFLKFFLLEENIGNKLALDKYCGVSSI